MVPRWSWGRESILCVSLSRLVALMAAFLRRMHEQRYDNRLGGCVCLWMSVLEREGRSRIKQGQVELAAQHLLANSQI